MITCKYCGTELLGNSTFCVKCGKNNIETADNKEIKKKQGGFFAGLFKHDKQNHVQNETLEDMTDGEVLIDFGEKEQLLESKPSDLVLDEVHEDILYRVKCLCDDLKGLLDSLYYDLDEALGVTVDYRASVIANTTQSFVEQEAISKVDRYFAQFLEVNIDKNKLISTIQIIWTSELCKNSFEKYENTLEDTDFSMLMNAYHSSYMEYKYIREKYIREFEEKSVNHRDYVAIGSVIRFLLDTILPIYELASQQLREAKNVKVTSEENAEKIIKNTNSAEQIVTTEDIEASNENKETIILKTTKVIGQTDVKYNICTFGAKFHIGFGVPVTIRMGCNVYSCKTHSSAKGRIDGMKRLYSENNIVLGDTIDAVYDSDTNTIEITKNDE